MPKPAGECPREVGDFLLGAAPREDERDEDGAASDDV